MKRKRAAGKPAARFYLFPARPVESLLAFSSNNQKIMSFLSRQMIAASAAALTIALAVVGCGGSSSPPLTKAEFIKQGDAICEKAESTKKVELESFLLKQGSKPLTLKQQEELATGVILPTLRTAANELGGLNPPEDSKDEGGKIVEEFSEVVSELEKNPLPLANLKAKDPFAAVAKRAGEYGFKVCILNY